MQPFYKGIHSDSTDDRSLLCSDLSSVYLVVSVIRSVLMTLTTTQAVDAHTYGSTTIQSCDSNSLDNGEMEK